MNEAPFGTMSPAIGKRADEIATWTRIVAVATTTVGALIGLGGLVVAASSQAIPAARRLVLAAALLYLITSVIAIVIGVVLLRYGHRMREVAKHGRVAALVDALEYENIYWRIAGLLVVISFSATLISSAVPNFRAALQHSQSHRTAHDMETIGQALEDYALREHQYPKATSIDELARVLEPRFVARMARRDANDRPFLYAVTCQNDLCGHYELSNSAGDVFADGHFTKQADAR